MPNRLRSPDCDCPGALNYSDSLDGGDEGGTFDGGFTVRPGTTAELEITVDAYVVKDAFSVYVDASLVLSSGCISGSAGYSATLGAGDHTVQVVVTPNCESTSDTAWAIYVVAQETRC